jgi:hypothetical protein
MALGIGFEMIAVGSFVGRWRANIWLKKNMSQEQDVSRVPRIA